MLSPEEQKMRDALNKLADELDAAGERESAEAPRAVAAVDESVIRLTAILREASK